MAVVRALRICAVLSSCFLSNGLQQSNTSSLAMTSLWPTWWPFGSHSSAARREAEAAAAEVEADTKAEGVTIEQLTMNKDELKEAVESAIATELKHQKKGSKKHKTATKKSTSAKANVSSAKSRSGSKHDNATTSVAVVAVPSVAKTTKDGTVKKAPKVLKHAKSHKTGAKAHNASAKVAASANFSISGPSKALEMAREEHRKAEQKVRNVASKLEQASANAQEMEAQAVAAMQEEADAKKDRYAAVKELRMAQREHDREAERMERKAVPELLKGRQMRIANKVVGVATKNLNTLAASVDQLHEVTETAKVNAKAALETKAHLQTLSLTAHSKEAAAQKKLAQKTKESEQLASQITELKEQKLQKLKAEQARAMRSYQTAKKLRMAAQRKYIAEDLAAAAKVKKINGSKPSKKQ